MIVYSGTPLNGHPRWAATLSIMATHCGPPSIEIVLMKLLIWGHPSIMAKIFGPNGGHYSRVPLLLKNWGHGQLVDLLDMQSARKGQILYTRWHWKFGPRAHSSWHVLYTNYDPKVSGRVGSSYSSTICGHFFFTRNLPRKWPMCLSQLWFWSIFGKR